MEQKIDKNGKRIPVSYFGDLKSKHDLAKGYVEMYNQFAADKNQPQINLEYALGKIKKQHDKFYGYDNKYDGKGSLRK